MGKFRDWLIEKLNPAQPDIVADQGWQTDTSTRTLTNKGAWKNYELVNRGVAMIVDSCSDIEIDIKEKIPGIYPTVGAGFRVKKLPTLLNFQPNPYYDANFFKQNIFLDLVIEGNAFIYWDGDE